MAQKPYKYNIEYIQRFYSYGSEAKAVEIQPKKQVAKAKPPKREKERVKTICIDPVAFCGMMVAIVMLLVDIFSWNFSTISLMLIAAVVGFVCYLTGKAGAKK